MSIIKTIIICAAIATSVQCASAETPRWLEADSASAIAARTRADFPYTVPEFLEIARERYPELTARQLDSLISHKYVETLMFDDTLRVFRKALRNMALLNPDMNGGWTSRNFDVTDARIANADSVLQVLDGRSELGAANRVVYRFAIDVPYDDAIAGDTLRVWMPLPFESQRQSNISIHSAAPARYELSDGRSIHNTLYFEAPAPGKGETAHFEYTASFDTKGQYFHPDSIRAHMRPYDRESDFYRTYTSTEAPHIVRLDSMARAIVGDETDPLRQSEMIYEYIDTHYPWAGAREYSTIPCIPTYVVEQGHGDCGQVSLLYISLMRSLGVPARWESGWMLHPGSKGYHDWAEVYFEGVGWVPVDTSFGRYPRAKDPRTVNFYSTGMDAYRFATNHGVCGRLYPPKRHVRSETVDFQAGEVETSRGNLFYPAWDHTLQIISITPIPLEK
ncbi:MAG: transglutaminase-like domain-containing protein [Bacteroidales bacterium]|nr:transglutaminase-like domain-containing protein [Bacteroidales bacterium]